MQGPQTRTMVVELRKEGKVFQGSLEVESALDKFQGREWGWGGGK